MKQFIKLAAVTAALAFSASAGATAITSTYTTATNTIDKSHPLSWTFDFGPQFGFVAGVDTFASANLRITLKDGGGTENFTFAVDNSLILTDKNIANSNKDVKFGPYSITGTSLADLSSTGKLSVKITETDNNGSFQFVSSSLAADLIKGKPSGSVPEPMSLALMGLGLFGIAAVRRKI